MVLQAGKSPGVKTHFNYNRLETNHQIMFRNSGFIQSLIEAFSWESDDRFLTATKRNDSENLKKTSIYW